MDANRLTHPGIVELGLDSGEVAFALKGVSEHVELERLEGACWSCQYTW